MANFEQSILTVAAGPGIAYAQLQHNGAAGTPRMRVRELVSTTQSRVIAQSRSSAPSRAA